MNKEKIQSKINELKGELEKLQARLNRDKRRTLLQFVIDESGSMASQRDDVIGSFNEYLSKQKEVKTDDAFVTISKFAYFSSNICLARDINEAPALSRESYSPAGGTALYDAVNSAIIQAQNTVEQQDIDRVLFIVITDGEENSSKFSNAQQVKSRIKALTEQGNWTFVYLGANQDAWAVGGNLGFLLNNTFTYNANDYKGLVGMTAGATMAYRSSSDLQAQNFTDSYRAGVGG